MDFILNLFKKKGDYLKSLIKESLIFDMLADVQKQIESLEKSKDLNTLSEYGIGTLDTFYTIKRQLLNLYQKGY
jgi:hypothetical protein